MTHKGINSPQIAFVLRLDNAIYKDLRDIANARCVSKVSIIRLLISEFVRKQKGKKQISPLADIT